MLKLFLLLILVPSFAYAQDPKPHAIDKALDACIDKDPSTAGMVRCLDIAYQAWDRELNRNYLAAMKKLSPSAKQSLKAAQLQWIKYRDAEFKLIDDVYSTLEGTMYIPMRVGQRIEVIKQRALELATYSDLGGEAGP
jgi:uncharacterized protein YecT (DUF1311 family)